MPRNFELAERPSVLLIEDERDLADEICGALRAGGLEVRHENTLADGLRVARSGAATVLVVDRMLGEDDGLSIVETLRGEGSALPVLVISGLSSVDDRIRGLKAGGDDYLVKPFALGELSARIEALLRRVDMTRVTRLRFGVLEMDLVDRSVLREGVSIELLPREFKLLAYFMRRPGQIVTREMLLQDVWNYKFLPQTNVVNVHIGNLRRKLGEGRKFIVSLRGEGFKLNEDA